MRSTRKGRVRIERMSSQASKLPITAPASWRSMAIACQCESAGALVAKTPAKTSEWPLIPLVAECMTISAPKSKARVKIGVAAVASTTSRPPAAWVASATSAISVVRSHGFEGVSIKTKSGWCWAQRLCACPISLKSASIRVTDRRAQNSRNHFVVPQ